MADHLDPVARSRLMASIKGRNTKPEIIVRRIAHRLGYRFRLHRKDLPGSPDIVFPARMKVIFVHGCFWHMHFGCRKSSTPKTNTEFWSNKIAVNISRDAMVQNSLLNMGWNYLIIWECETRNIENITSKIVNFLE